jgi:hypothetical protein
VPILQIGIKQPRRGSVAAPLGESDDLDDADAVIESNREHVTKLHEMAWRLLARAIEPDMTSLDQSSRAGPGFDHARMPQPFVETLTLQATPI